MSRSLGTAAFICITLFAAAQGHRAFGPQDVCDVHRKAAAKLSEQADSMTDQLAYNARDEERSRTTLSDLNKAISSPGMRNLLVERLVGSTTSHQMENVKNWGVKWKDEYRENKVLLLRALRDAQIREVERITYARSHQAELSTQLTNLLGQLGYHRNRLAELGCKEKQDEPKNGCDGFNGTWKTDFGEMTFAITGSIVTATYDFDTGNIRGGLSDDGRVLSGTYSENKARGTFRFELSADSQSFTGTWRRTSGTRNPPNGTWGGKCIRL